MSLSSQLLLGNIANIAGFVFGILLIVISLPMLIWLIVSIVRWVKGSHIIFKWWGVTAVTLCGLGLIIYCFARIFGGASYTIASKVDIHVPMSVRVLENGSYVAIDGSESYTVVQLSETQMNTFINSAKKDWRFGTVVPYSLLRVPSGDYPMFGKANPLPNTKRNGYYHASLKRSNEKYAGSGGYVTRKVYFLDVTSKILYVYSYQGQGP